MQKTQPLEKGQLRIIFGEREIETLMKRRVGKPLTQTERNYLSASIRPKLRAIHAIEQLKLLPEVNRRKESMSRQDIIFNLGRFGYELIARHSSKNIKKIPLEKLIVQILLRFPEARFIEAIPILMLKNPIDMFQLGELAAKWHVKNQLGFLIEIALELHKKKELEILVEYLRKTKEKEQHLLGEDLGKVYRDFVAQASPPRMVSWNLLGRFFDEDFRTAARLYL